MSMKSEFLIAITQLAAERNLPRDIVLNAVEAALISAFKKDHLAELDLAVRISPVNGEVHVFARQTVVETAALTDPRLQIALEEASKLKAGIALGGVIEHEVTPANAGRIAAQTAKQVVMQRLREAERDLVFAEYAGKENTLLSALVQRYEGRSVILDLGRAEAIMPLAEQSPTERYRPGQRIKVVVLEVWQSAKGPQIVVSRSHKDLLRRLFELEVPEIASHVVEIKAIARETGFRSKIAVAAAQERVDPVGSCVGLRGVRIQNIVNELHGEKIDVVEWRADPAAFLSRSLGPAQVLSVHAKAGEKTAVVVVPDRHLSLAIGREGQNARLAAKLTGWRIDIKSASEAETLQLGPAPQAPKAPVVLAPPAEIAERRAAPVVAAQPEAAVEAKAEPAVAAAAEAPTLAEALGKAETWKVPAPAARGIRFAEDILGKAGRGSDVKAKGKGKGGGGGGREDEEAGAARKPKSGRKNDFDYVPEDDEDEA